MSLSLDTQLLDAELARLDAGDAAAIDRARKHLDAAVKDPAHGAWSVTWQLAAYLTHEPTAAPSPWAPGAPTLDDLAALRDGPARARGAARRGCVRLARLALLRWNPTALDAASKLHADLGGAEDAATELPMQAAALWARAFRVEPGLGPEGEALFARAAQARHAALVVEATALRAMLALADGAIDEAVAHARRASRMGRTEALPFWETLAHVVLARTRRHAGKPHLGLRILGDVARQAPWIYRSWLGWELALAGGALAEAGRGAAPADDVIGHAWRMLGPALTAIGTGERAAADAALARLRAAAAPCPLLAHEVGDVLAALDLTQAARPTVEAWRAGAGNLPPCGLHGLGGGSPASERQTSSAAVVADPDRKGQRVLTVGLPLVAAGGAVTVGEVDQARPATGLAALALAGPAGLDKLDFFRAVYGFTYVEDRHRKLLDVLVHRMRAASATVGELDRSGDRLTLRLRARAIIPDPRCAREPEELLARHLARTGPQSSEAAAETLGLPVRTVRAILQRLVEDGVCRILRDGRNVRYQVEDTTFTQTSILARPPG